MAQDQFAAYSSIDFQSLRRIELGPRSFDSIHNLLLDLKSLYDQIIEIALRIPDLPAGINSSVVNNINTFIANIVKPIQEYDYAKDERNQFNNHNEITRRVRELHNRVFSEQQHNLLLLFSTARSYDIAGASRVISQVEQARKSLDDLGKQQQSVLNSLRTKAGEQTIQDYARIFGDQANKHSSFSLKLKPQPKLVIGAAYFWIATAIVVLCLGVANIHYIDDWFPLNSSNSYVLIGALIKRVALISLWLFLVAFGFRQFSVNKHLATLNRHRQNALNSFRLFIETIGPQDATARAQLMLQVAKAIYEQGPTGYLSHKLTDQKEPSILELTRLVSGHQ
jgi:hypothetical protein